MDTDPFLSKHHKGLSSRRWLCSHLFYIVRQNFRRPTMAGWGLGNDALPHRDLIVPHRRVSPRNLHRRKTLRRDRRSRTDANDTNIYHDTTCRGHASMATFNLYAVYTQYPCGFRALVVICARDCTSHVNGYATFNSARLSFKRRIAVHVTRAIASTASTSCNYITFVRSIRAVFYTVYTVCWSP